MKKMGPQRKRGSDLVIETPRIFLSAKQAVISAVDMLLSKLQQAEKAYLFGVLLLYQDL